MVDITTNQAGAVIFTLVIIGAFGLSRYDPDKTYHCPSLPAEIAFKECESLSGTSRTCYYTDFQQSLEDGVKKLCPDGKLWAKVASEEVQDLIEELNSPAKPKPTGAYTLIGDNECCIDGNIALEFRGKLVDGNCVKV